MESVVAGTSPFSIVRAVKSIPVMDVSWCDKSRLGVAADAAYLSSVTEVIAPAKNGRRPKAWDKSKRLQQVDRCSPPGLIFLSPVIREEPTPTAPYDRAATSTGIKGLFFTEKSERASRWSTTYELVAINISMYSHVSAAAVEIISTSDVIAASPLLRVIRN
ncbi:hypothetical protein J6590_002185 [Homalodisca vitripennis]|nr:hypothetical protein J6590_002185 [Homalodisca vitripennis]